MAQHKQRYDRRRPSLVGPLLLITAGILFLLSNLGILDLDIWQLWRLWPVLLILAGVDILIGRRSFLGSIVVTILAIAVLGSVILVLVAAPGLLEAPGSGGVDYIAEPLDGIESANLKVTMATGELMVGPLVDSSSLIEGDLALATEQRPTWELERSRGQADMRLAYEGAEGLATWGRGDEWDLCLSPSVTWSLVLGVGAGSATLDLTGLDIRDLDLDGGAGQTMVTFPGTGDVSARVSGGAGRLVLEIPREMAARIEVNRGLGALDIPSRFERRGDFYVSEGWDASQNRLDLEIDIGVGSVILRER